MKNKSKFFITIPVFVIFVLVCVILYFNSNNTQTSYGENTQNNTYYCLSIHNDYGVDGNKSLSEFFSENDSLERLMSFNNDLHTNIDYIELCFQPLQYMDYYDKDSKFVDDEDNINQSVTLDSGESKYVTNLKSVQIDKNIYGSFDNSINKGRNFTEDDFYINTGDQTINVILGNDYSDYYDIGDIIDISLYEKDLTLNVIGFYKENTTLSINGAKTLLDTYIIMPSFFVNYSPETETENKYQKILYSQKNAGFALIEENNNDSYNEEDSYIIQTAEKYNLLYSLTSSPLTLKIYDGGKVTENVENSYTDTYYCNNKILSPVTVQFGAQININKNNNSYYIADASYSKPLVINVKQDSFQINETNEELTNSGKTYIVLATGNYVKDNIDMGEVTLSAYFDIDTNTGKITSSSNM